MCEDIFSHSATVFDKEVVCQKVICIVVLMGNYQLLSNTKTSPASCKYIYLYFVFLRCFFLPVLIYLNIDKVGRYDEKCFQKVLDFEKMNLALQLIFFFKLDAQSQFY